MVQATEYPWSGKLALTVNPKSPKTFSVRIRVPDHGISRLYKNTPEIAGLESLSVNGKAVKPAMERGYAVITRAWKAGDKVEAVLPMKVQRVRADERVEATRNKVALRYGPLIYNVEQADQDITKVLSPDAPLTTEWRSDLLGGVMTIKGKFADGTPLLAVPNYARMNRDVASVPAEGAERTGPRPPASIVWIRES